jgi:hypothetical protein
MADDKTHFGGFLSNGNSRISIFHLMYFVVRLTLDEGFEKNFLMPNLYCTSVSLVSNLKPTEVGFILCA